MNRLDKDVDYICVFATLLEHKLNIYFTNKLNSKILDSIIELIDN